MRTIRPSFGLFVNYLGVFATTCHVQGLGANSSPPFRGQSPLSPPLQLQEPLAPDPIRLRHHARRLPFRARSNSASERESAMRSASIF
jgi:hypothetical protein